MGEAQNRLFFLHTGTVFDILHSRSSRRGTDVLRTQQLFRYGDFFNEEVIYDNNSI